MKKYLTYLKIAAAAFVAAIVITACNSNLFKTENFAKSIHLSPLPTTLGSATDRHTLAKVKKINLNSASLLDLDRLEVKLGIPTIANRIQAERPYQAIEDLIDRQIIDRQQLDKIKEMLTVEEVEMTKIENETDYMAKLQLMKGHIFAAKQLIAANKVKEAERHVGHPIQELYIDVSDRLHERKVKEFKSNILGLEDLVKAGATDRDRVTTDFSESMRSIDTAISTLPLPQRQSVTFVLPVINSILDAANATYGEAIDDGKIEDIEEYQDTWGFMVYADTLYRSIATEMAQKHPTEHQTILIYIQQLKTVLPGSSPPTIAVKSPAEVGKIITAIEQITQTIIGSS